MYLSRLTTNGSRAALGWISNSYRVHQRLKMACPQDPRLLFRIEDEEGLSHILVQSHLLPDWAAAFNDFNILKGMPEMKVFDPQPASGLVYAFRLLANPTIKHEGRRIGLGKEEEQNGWLSRHLAASGAEVLRAQVQPYRIQRSRKGEEKNPALQTHLIVQFDGLLLCHDAGNLRLALENGIGPAKAYGCGLLSLARAA